uniref:Reverse transcriptase zinc-binding domain-containing protein n=1 Tax=Triticum urartu TaxID=4572 RepID=A0A8R7UJR6_TRIUA
MSCFQIPAGVCDKLKKPISNFWWGMENGKKKVHWRSWDWLSSPKYVGSMGFRDMAIFNQAMLGKQCWRLLTEPQSLCSRVMKGHYFPDGDFWSAQCPRSSSYTWRSIMHGKKLLQQGIMWRVGNGKTIKILRGT